MGIYKVENSPYWQYSFKIPGRSQQRGSTKETDKKLAEAVYKKISSDHRGQKNFGDAVDWTIDGLLDWAEETIWADCKRPDYLKSVLKPIRAHCGKRSAAEFGPDGILAFRKKRINGDGDVKGVSVSTAIHSLTYLSAAYEAAINCDKLFINPVKRARKAFPALFPASEARLIALDSEHQEILLNRASGMLKLVIAFALRTGMRQGEILRLEWGDVDFKRMQMRTWSQKGRTKKIKERFVPILPDILEILGALPRTGKTVFAHEDGRPFSENGIVHSPYHRLIISLAETYPVFKDFDFHGLRHSFITEQLTLGGNIVALGRIVGHSSSVMTDRYGHLSKSKLTVEMNLLPRLKGLDVNTGFSRILADSPTDWIEVPSNQLI